MEFDKLYFAIQLTLFAVTECLQLTADAPTGYETHTAEQARAK